jgi:hypothetical protein
VRVSQEVKRRAWLRRTAVAFVAAAGACALLALALVWRLSQSPIRLRFLTPSIEAAIRARAPDVHAQIGATELAWDGESRRILLRARDVLVRASDGAEVVRLPVVAVRPRLLPLVRGVIEIAAVELVGAEIHLVRERDGTLRLAGLDTPGSDRGARETRSRLGSRIGEDDLFSGRLLRSLGRIRVHGGNVTLADAETGWVSQAKDVNLSVWAEEVGAAAELRGGLLMGEFSVPIEASASYRGGDAGAEINITFADVTPARLAAQIAASGTGAWLGRLLTSLDMPLGGTVHALLDARLKPQVLRVDLAAGSGRLRDAGEVSFTWPVRSAVLKGTVDLDASRLDLNDSIVRLDGVEVHVQGSWSGAGDGGRLDAEIRIPRLEIGDLWNLWPPRVAPDVRKWVLANVSGGGTREVRVRLMGNTSANGAGSVSVEQLAGSLIFDALTVRYLETIPAITGVSGNATFSTNEAIFQVTAGGVDGVSITAGSVRIAAPDAGPASINIQAAVQGGLQGALRVLDHEPVKLLRALEMQPVQFDGQVSGQLRLAFPLRGALGFSELGLTAEASLVNVSVREVLRDWTVRDGNLSLDLDPRGYALSGTASVEDVSARIVMKQSLAQESAPAIEIAARMDDAARRRMGFDVGGWMQGPADLIARLVDRETVSLDVDLTQAAIDSTVKWLDKEAGAPARATARLRLAKGDVAAVEDFRYTAAGVTITGGGSLGGNGNSWQAVRAIIDPFGSGDDPRAIHVAVDKAATGHRFNLKAEDAGPMIRALTDGDATGGHLVAEGTVDLGAPARGFEGQLTVRDFTLTRAPVLARIIELASLRGLMRAFSEKETKFDYLATGFAYHPPKVVLTGGRARGPTIAILFDGNVDLDARILDWRGRLIPSYYGLNEAAKRLPVVGGLLSRATGGAVFAIEFQVTGGLDDPKITINPLRSLAPGALRDLLRSLER